MITSSNRSSVAELSERFSQTFTVNKRDGRNVPFAADRIYKALERAFYAEFGLGEGGQLDQETLWQIGSMTEAVVESLMRRGRVSANRNYSGRGRNPTDEGWVLQCSQTIHPVPGRPQESPLAE